MNELLNSDVCNRFFPEFTAIFANEVTRNNPESYLDFQSSLEKYINSHAKHTADAKAKADQYFTILNRIEYVITLDAKYKDCSFLTFWRKFNTLYNMMHRSEDIKDAIEVYFDNQIGIIEVETQEPETKKQRTTKVAEGKELCRNHQFDILAIIEARNEQEARVGELIEEFEGKIADFFDYVRNSPEGDRLIVKIKSHVAEDEIYDEFAKIYRKYKILNRNKIGNHFFKETEDLVNKLCDDFEVKVRE